MTLQVLLGFLSVYMRLAVLPVSFHTLLAATILTFTVGVAVLTWAHGEARAHRASRPRSERSDMERGTGQSGMEAEALGPFSREPTRR